MTNFQRIKGYYEKGLYRLAHLQKFVLKGVLTQAEFDLLTKPEVME